jgi:hypothetical protein
MWIAALVVSIVCLAGLAYGLVTDWNTPVKHTVPSAKAIATGSGFWLGLLVGLGAGIVLGSLIALKKRD